MLLGIKVNDGYMKKIFLALIMCCCVCSLSAQDSLKVDAKTDMLIARVAQLEHDVNFLTVKCELSDAKSTVNDYCNSISNNIQELEIYIVNKKHKKNYDILDQHILVYQAHLKCFTAFQSHYNSLKKYVDEIIASNNFRKDEIELIQTTFDSILSTIDLYEARIETYRLKILEYDSKKK